jgi:2-oxoglutarate ferredoxin oxidoreductase subunit alpha
MYNLTIRAFNLAETYRTPVIFLADEIVAHMRERITIPPSHEIGIVNRKKPKKTDKAFFNTGKIPPMPSVGDGFNVPITGSTHSKHGHRYTADPIVHKQLVEGLANKINKNANQIINHEDYNIENCEIIIVSYGCTSRAVHETIELAKRRGINAGSIRLKTLWPFPEKAIRSLARNIEMMFVPEMNLGQIFYEVERAVHGAAPVLPINKIGGGEMITPEELLAEITRNVSNID